MYRCLLSLSLCFDGLFALSFFNYSIRSGWFIHERVFSLLYFSSKFWFRWPCFLATTRHCCSEDSTRLETGGRSTLSEEASSFFFISLIMLSFSCLPCFQLFHFIVNMNALLYFHLHHHFYFILFLTMKELCCVQNSSDVEDVSISASSLGTWKIHPPFFFWLCVFRFIFTPFSSGCILLLDGSNFFFCRLFFVLILSLTWAVWFCMCSCVGLRTPSPVEGTSLSRCS